MQANDSIGVDQNIATQLVEIPARTAKTSSFHEKFRIYPRRSWSIDIPPATAFHSISCIQGAGLVDKHRPRQTRLADVGLRRGPEFESDDNYVDSQSSELVLMLTQLRQVFAAGQSREMAVEHEQEPIARVLTESVGVLAFVRQFEGGGVEAYPIDQWSILVFFGTQIGHFTAVPRSRDCPGHRNRAS